MLQSHIVAMDTSSAWLSELEMQDQGFVNHFDEKGFVNQLQMIRPYYVVADFSVDSFSSERNSKNPSFVDQAFESPSTIKATTNINRIQNYKSIIDINNKNTPTDEKPKPEPFPNIPNTFTLSFGDPNPKDEFILLSDSLGCSASTKKGQTVIRNRIQLQDHMLAERKRREKLARRFVALSALLPGLKKMDKVAVLEDASNYIRELQGRVKELEGSSEMKEKYMQPTLFAKRSKLSCSNDDGSWSSDEANIGEIRSPCNPEIEVRILGNSVLIRIYCRKNYVSLVKVIDEIEKFGLSVTSSSTLPFASTTFLITVIAMKNNDFFMTSADLVRNLQLAI